MDIEELVQKYYEEWQTVPEASIQDQIRAALTELAERIRQLEAERVPEGWVIVPGYSTGEMDVAGADAADLEGFDRFKAETVYLAMLAAAPAKEGE